MRNTDGIEILVFFIITTLLILTLTGFILLILFLYKRTQEGFAKELTQVRINYEKESLKTQLEIQEQTFQYISQDIHDNIGQFISLAKLHLNTLNLTDTKASARQVDNSIDLLTRALEDLRDLSKSLSSEIIRNGGLTKAIEQQVNQLNKLQNPVVTYELNGDYRFLDEHKEIFILRILQEAINNVIRHSGADIIEIVLNYFDDNLSLTVRDNGKGFDIGGIGKKNTSGINNMMKRAEMIGAVFNIKSSPHSGTSVFITVPY
jgi:two-component system NarL family sensor kinase